MTERLIRRILATVALAVAVANPLQAQQPTATGAQGAMERARADSLRYPYTQADIDFMSGMIHHHAQAILISRWARTHGASPPILRLTARIINAQTDEITLMQDWLKARHQTPPEVDSTGNVTMPPPAGGHADHGDHDAHADHNAAGHDGHDESMPGMLSEEQLEKLNSARGPEFDQLFLEYMIQHHRGAVEMIRTLFASHGAGQDEMIFKFAADVEVDQSTEIRRMLQMLIEYEAP